MKLILLGLAMAILMSGCSAFSADAFSPMARNGIHADNLVEVKF